MKLSLTFFVLLGACQAKRPNILFFLTDDQDLHMESVEHMQYLKVGNLELSLHIWLTLMTIVGRCSKRHNVQSALLHCSPVLSLTSDSLDRTRCTQSQYHQRVAASRGLPKDCRQWN